MNFGRGYRGGYSGGGRRGMGFRWRNSFGYHPDDFVSDVTLLENESRILQERLSNVEKELGRIRKGKDEG